MKKDRKNQIIYDYCTDSITKKIQFFIIFVLICATLMLFLLCNAFESQLDQMHKQLAFWAEQGSVVSAMKCKVGDGVYSVSIQNSQELTMNSDANQIETTIVRCSRIQNITEKDIEVLCRIVEAEAGGEDYLGKKMVADVVINRVLNSHFPSTVKGVVFEGANGSYQFSPISDGRYYQVKVSKETRTAVDDALYGTDDTNGALYFISPSIASTDNYMWFQGYLSYVTSHGLHCFYK